jgi:outer membrane autotransporter protein
MARLFARRNADAAAPASIFPGKSFLNGMDFSTGRMFAFSANGETPRERERRASYSGRPEQSGPEWLALAGGGWEGRQGRNGLWIAPSYSLTEHHGGRDYSIRGPGVAAGIDRWFTDVFYLGLALAMDFPRYDGNDARTDGRSATGLLYGGFILPWDLEFCFSASFGRTSFEQARDTALRRYRSDFSAETFGVGAGLGRQFRPTENLLLRPFAAWDFFRIDRFSHSDEQRDIFALRYDKTQNNLHRLRAGVEAAYTFEKGYIAGKAFWSGLHGDTTEDVRAAFVMDPGNNTFEAPVDGLDGNSLGLAAGIGFHLGENIDLTLSYSFLGGKANTSHQGMLGLRLNF